MLRPPPNLCVSVGLTVAIVLAGSGCYVGLAESDVGADYGTTTAATSPTNTADPDSDTAAGSTGEEGDSSGPMPPGFVPGPATFPRLTRRQYENSIAMLLGPGLPTPALEPDTNPFLFFNIGNATTIVSELGVAQYEEAADLLAGMVFADPAWREALVGCVPEAAADPCVAGFLTRFGRQAYRRPLTGDEHLRWMTIADALSDGDPWQGLRHAVAGMLQSPHFLYRVELGEPDPLDPTRWRYTSLEMASRLSFLLWNGPPDDALLTAGEQGDLLSTPGILAEAQRMIADPRGHQATFEFFDQYLDLRRLDGVVRDPERHPLVTPTLLGAMHAEVMLIVNDLVYQRDSDIRAVFSTRDTFVNSDLAALYGLTIEGVDPVTFVATTLPESTNRAGILTLGAFLTMNAHETETSPTARGKYLRERVLCQTVPSPPDDVDLNLDPKEGAGLTLRERLEQHRADPTCAGCHAFIDPPGYLFEHFDSIGAWRELDNGHPIDASGDFDGTPLAHAGQLGALLQSDVRVASCIVKQLYRHAASRLDLISERPGLDAVTAQFVAADYRFLALLEHLVTSELFRSVAEEEIDP